MEYQISSQEYAKAVNLHGLAAAINGFKLFHTGKVRQTDVDSDDKIVKTACRACIANCGVLAHVKDGHVIKLEGNPDDPMSKGRMCAKGLSGIQALYHPNRNKYPLKRVGPRGGNRWRRISWEEALGTIADKLMQTRAQYGAESVVCSTGGGGNPEIWSIARFCNIFGTPNWFEPGCAQCYLPRVLAYTMMYGGTDPSIADSNALEIYFPDDTPIKSLVLWGSNPSYSCPASGGGAVVELRRRGVKTVVIDPRFTPDAAKADVWLPIRPGTDVALMLAWIRYILENKLYDRDFLLRWSNLPFLVDTETGMLLRQEEAQTTADAQETFFVWDTQTKTAKPMIYPYDEALAPALEGSYTVNGRLYKTGFQLLWERSAPYTLEKAAEICWLEKDKIEQAIRIYTDYAPSSLTQGVAMDQNPNSVQAAMAAATLDILLGNVERPGALMQRFRTSGVLKEPNYPVPRASSLLPPEQLKKRLGGNEFKGLHLWDAAHAGSILDAILTGEPYQPKVWIDRSGNKLGVVAQSEKWVEAIEKLDFIVHMYMYPTSFSAYADILLPTAEWLETNMIVETCNTLVARQAVTSLWETVDETLIWSKLAKACAERGHEMCQKAFDAEFMGEEMAYWNSVEEFFDQLTSKIDLTWQEFAAKTPFEYMDKDQWRTYYVYLQADAQTGKPQGFPTPSRKLEVYLESLIMLGRSGEPFSKVALPAASKEYDPLPYYLEPHESPVAGGKLAEEYPLVMTTGRVPYYHHSTLRNIPALRELCPVAEVWIHPDTARSYGIAPDDWVWIESQRGKIRAKALITRGISPGVVCMERFWNPETLNTETRGWREMNVNVLTKADAPYNDVVGTYTLRGFLVKISRAEGPPKGVWLTPEDFKTWLPAPAKRT